MEHIQIHFPETWTHNRCDEWMVQHELMENGRDIKDTHHVYTVLIKENEIEHEEQQCKGCGHLRYNCVCELAKGTN